MTRIKIAAVSYLNTKPFLYGLQHCSIIDKIDLQTFMPSVCADKLLSGEVDLGLIPVAVIPRLKKHEIISDYCIGAVGAVNSVLILSEVPVDKIESVYLDYQSRTSVELAQLLLKNYWNKEVRFIVATAGYEDKISGTTAAVVIGDRALQLQFQHKYAYDLAEAWFNYTQMPFVFACWVANKKLPGDFIEEFNAACKYGIDHINNLVSELKKEGNYYPGTLHYLRESLSYDFDNAKRKGLQLFLDKISQQVI